MRGLEVHYYTLLLDARCALTHVRFFVGLVSQVIGMAKHISTVGKVIKTPAVRVKKADFFRNE